MINEKTLLGFPTSFLDKIEIYPPKVKEVVGNDNFWQYYKVLTFSQEEIEDEFVNNKDIKKFPTPLEFLLSNSYYNSTYAQIVREAFQFFCHVDCLLVYDLKKIMLGTSIEEEINTAKTVDDLFFLDESNFFDFQNKIRASIGEKGLEPPNPKEDPRIKRIKAKARYRDKIKAKKGIGLKLSTSLVAIFCMNVGLNPLNVGEISYASVHAIARMYQEKEKYEIDIRSLQAGADSKKIKPVYWIRNLDD